MGEVPGSVPGTVLTPATLAVLGRSKDLLIRGRSSIDLYGNFALGGFEGPGSFTLGSLTLDTPLLNGIGSSSDTATISAGLVTLRNSFAPGVSGPATAGVLALRANTLTFGPADVQIAHFGMVSAVADTLRVDGTGTLAFSG
jgi:hypothetical protein